MTRYHEAIAELRSVGKPNYGAPAYSRWVNRPLGRRLAAAAFVAGLTPNQVTGLSASASLVGVALIGWPEPTWLTGLLITATLLLGYALDSADGQLARLRGGGSASGEWLDHMVDTAKIVVVHGAVLISWLRWTEGTQWWIALLPLGFILAGTMAFFGWQLSELLRRRGGDGVAKPTQAPVARSLLRAPSDWGVLCLVFLVWSTDLFAPAYGLLMAANMLIMLLALPVWFRQAGSTS